MSILNLGFGAVEKNQLFFQDSASPLAEGIVNLHHYIWFFGFIIGGFVIWILFSSIYDHYNQNIFKLYSSIDNKSKFLNHYNLKIIKEQSFYIYVLVLNKVNNFLLLIGQKSIFIENKILFFSNTNSLNRIYNSKELEFETTVRVNHGAIIEIIWTTVPALILVCIAIPSFYLLYALEEIIEPTLIIRAIGHQWYWSYDYLNSIKNIFDGNNYLNSLQSYETWAFDSYMVLENDLESGQLRLLEVDNPLVLPTFTNICILVTSTDVLHSWAIPSLGVKIDAVPGRLNQINVYIIKEGRYFGQCSELCGVNHGFMPIEVRAIGLYDWFKLHKV